jgi:hypothetical protein
MTGPAMVAAGLDIPAMAPVGIEVEHPDLEGFGRSDGETALVWVHDIDWTVGQGDPALQSGARLSLDGLPDGCAILHDTVNGEVLDEIDAPDEVLDLPAFRGDLAMVLGAKPCTEARACACSTTVPSGGIPAGALLILVALPIRRRSPRP